MWKSETLQKMQDNSRHSWQRLISSTCDTAVNYQAVPWYRQAHSLRSQRLQRQRNDRDQLQIKNHNQPQSATMHTRKEWPNGKQIKGAYEAFVTHITATEARFTAFEFGSECQDTLWDLSQGDQEMANFLTMFQMSRFSDKAKCVKVTTNWKLQRGAQVRELLF